MPKDRSYIYDLQEQRQRNRMRRSNEASGKCYLQILGSGAPGAPKSVYFFTDHDRWKKG